MTAVAVGVLIAVAFGSGDFAGGRASSSVPTLSVLAVAQACSVLGAAALVIVVPGDVQSRDLLIGAIAGVVNVTGLGLLYAGLARHAAAVVAPVAAVVGSLVPVLWGLLRGERPSSLVLAGIAAAMAAAALVSLGPSEERVGTSRGAAMAVAAGVALGSSLVLFSETDGASGQWPVLAARAGALVAVVVATTCVARIGWAQRPRGRTLALAVTAGAFDVTATALLVYAVRRELLSVVAPIVSLAPGFTVVLAWLLTHQRVNAVQRVGLAVAVAGLALIAAG
jgi:drug/metabolite transporter (DMT)-like permease